jgi:hypothetical protein
VDAVVAHNGRRVVREKRCMELIGIGEKRDAGNRCQQKRMFRRSPARQGKCRDGTAGRLALPSSWRFPLFSCSIALQGSLIGRLHCCAGAPRSLACASSPDARVRLLPLRIPARRQVRHGKGADWLRIAAWAEFLPLGPQELFRNTRRPGPVPAGDGSVLAADGSACGRQLGSANAPLSPRAWVLPRVAYQGISMITCARRSIRAVFQRCWPCP